MHTFLEFYELVQKHQVRKVLFEPRIDEADFKKGVDYSKQADYAGATPSNANVASDNLQGRNTQQLPVDPRSRRLDKAVKTASWQKYAAANPALAALYSKLHASNKSDRQANRKEDDALGIGDYVRRGGNVIGQEATPPNNYEAKLKQMGNDGSARFALMINQVIHKLRSKYANHPVDDALLASLQQDIPPGRESDLVQHITGLKQGLATLFRVAGKDLFTKGEAGWVVSPKGHTGDSEELWAQPGGDAKIMTKIMQKRDELFRVADGLTKELGNEDAAWMDPNVMKKARELYRDTTLFQKGGSITGPHAEEVKDLHRALETLFDMARTKGTQGAAQ